MIAEFAISTAMTASSLTGGAGKTAGYVENLRRANKEHIERSYTFGSALDRARHELHQIVQECSIPDWDGFGAVPVSNSAYLNARRFLEALPLGAEAPAPGADPDGDLTLEWYHGPRHTLSVSVGRKGDLNYAALVGVNKTFGTEAFFGDIPKTIVDLISRISEGSAAAA